MQELKDEYISNKPLRFFSGRRNVNKLSYRNYIFYRKNEKSIGIVVVSDFSLSRVERDRECENEDTKIVHISEHMRELSAGQFFLCLVQRLVLLEFNDWKTTMQRARKIEGVRLFAREDPYNST